ncbi:hypothetical protein [Duganella sp. S19_KUP01_CR8]|uniref:hypothetical protein n=1 Tax=Duganella sp. S19_KUP01_CR8 TaxID=3025502 RepID=UPI002FCD9724
MNKRRILMVVTWSLLACSSGHAQDKDKAAPPVLQLTGGGEVARWSGEPLDDPAIGENTIDWQYPVFKGGDKAALERLNAWTRTVSLAALFQDDALLQKAIRSKDSGVLALLANDKAARESVMTQSKLFVSLRFARHITFDLHIEMPGQARTTHGISHRIFDFKNGREVPVKSLFKSNAALELDGLLMDEIALGLEEKKASPSDIEHCQHERPFEWGTVSIQSGSKIAVEFPNSSGDSAKCGEAHYILSGPAVRKLFLSPQDFNKGVTL